MFSVIENSLNLDALYLVKLIFGEYFYFDSNRVADLLQLQLYLDANRIPVRERVCFITVFLFYSIAIKFIFFFSI